MSMILPLVQYYCLLLLLLTTASWVTSLSAPRSPLRVVVVGGTHGNEYTGVWCIKALDREMDALRRRYPSLRISTLLANREAHMANKRFIDTDLNREFHADRLCPLDDDDGGFAANSIEAVRARQVDALLGPKCNDDEPERFDVAIDLHSTTSNMGTTLIINEGDELMARGAAYVSTRCPDARCIMHAIPDRRHRATLSSTARYGFTIEVGPVPVGVLRHDTVMKTEKALHALLEFLQGCHGKDEAVILRRLLEDYPGGMVPCYRTAPAVRPGELSGKISWPCDPDNRNFPVVLVHESLQDRDFHVLRKGDPLFVALDRSVIPYDGSHGDTVYVVFVNEAGYYYASSGTGIGVAIKTEFDLWNGNFADSDVKVEVDQQME